MPYDYTWTRAQWANTCIFTSLQNSTRYQVLTISRVIVAIEVQLLSSTFRTRALSQYRHLFRNYLGRKRQIRMVCTCSSLACIVEPDHQHRTMLAFAQKGRDHDHSVSSVSSETEGSSDKVAQSPARRSSTQYCCGTGVHCCAVNAEP